MLSGTHLARVDSKKINLNVLNKRRNLSEILLSPGLTPCPFKEHVIPVTGVVRSMTGPQFCTLVFKEMNSNSEFLTMHDPR